MTNIDENTPRYVSNAIETELIYGALQRSKKAELMQYIWMAIAGVALLLGGMGFAFNRVAPPVLIPFDPSTGFAVPNALVETKKITEQQAVIHANVYAYIKDRETFDQLANDIRVPRAMSRSIGRAKTSITQLWSDKSIYYPPKKYGANAVLEVNVLSIALIGKNRVGTNRAQVRIVKQLTNGNERTKGFFTIILAYQFRPEEIRNLESVWNNPFGFTVSEYSITPDKKGTIQ